MIKTVYGPNGEAHEIICDSPLEETYDIINLVNALRQFEVDGKQKVCGNHQIVHPVFCVGCILSNIPVSCNFYNRLSTWVV